MSGHVPVAAAIAFSLGLALGAGLRARAGSEAPPRCFHDRFRELVNDELHYNLPNSMCRNPNTLQTELESLREKILQESGELAADLDAEDQDYLTETFVSSDLLRFEGLTCAVRVLSAAGVPHGEVRRLLPREAPQWEEALDGAAQEGTRLRAARELAR